MLRTNMTDEIRNKIKKILIDRNLSQTEAAREAGISRQYLNNMLNGQSGDLPDSWTKLFDVLGVKVDIVPNTESVGSTNEPLES